MLHGPSFPSLVFQLEYPGHVKGLAGTDSYKYWLGETTRADEERLAGEYAAHCSAQNKFNPVQTIEVFILPSVTTKEI